MSFTNKPTTYCYSKIHTDTRGRVEKRDTSSNYATSGPGLAGVGAGEAITDANYSPYSSRNSSHLGAHEAGLTGSQGTAQ